MVCTALSEQARRDPERVAVTAGADSITFGELDSRVRALAAQVISRRRRLPDEALAPTAFDGWSGSVLPVAVDRSIGRNDARAGICNSNKHGSMQCSAAQRSDPSRH